MRGRTHGEGCHSLNTGRKLQAHIDGDTRSALGIAHPRRIQVLVGGDIQCDREKFLLEIWRNNREEQNDVIELTASEQCLVIWRQNLIPQVAEVSKLKYQMLDDLRHGYPLDDIIAHPGLAEDVLRYLPEFIEQGWVVG